MAINGKSYDWEDVNVILPQGTAAGITEIKYSDEQPVTAHYGKGAIPRGYGRGNYAASGSMVLDRDEWERLKKELAAGGGIYDHDPFTIVVTYANNDQPETVDTLKSCKISKFDGGGGAQGDDKVTAITCEFTILEPIEWGGVPAKTDSGLSGAAGNTGGVTVGL
jgi:hypothetical protein